MFVALVSKMWAVKNDMVLCLYHSHVTQVTHSKIKGHRWITPQPGFYLHSV